MKVLLLESKQYPSALSNRGYADNPNSRTDEPFLWSIGKDWQVGQGHANNSKQRILCRFAQARPRPELYQKLDALESTDTDAKC